MIFQFVPSYVSYLKIVTCLVCLILKLLLDASLHFISIFQVQKGDFLILKINFRVVLGINVELFPHNYQLHVCVRLHKQGPWCRYGVKGGHKLDEIPIPHKMSPRTALYVQLLSVRNQLNMEDLLENSTFHPKIGSNSVFVIEGVYGFEVENNYLERHLPNGTKFSHK